jgi:hypothetical protein
MNYMKKQLLTIICSTLLTLNIMFGGVVVHAYTPSVAVPDIITTDTTRKIKIGGIFSEKYLLSDLGFFKKMFLPGTDSWLMIGGNNQISGGAITNPPTGRFPLTVDIAARPTTTTGGIVGKNAVLTLANPGMCNAVGIVNAGASLFDFQSTGNNGNADIIARQLQLIDGSPKTNSVLAAVDIEGNAVWATLQVNNGVIEIVDNQRNSPVVIASLCADPEPPEPTDRCSNIPGIQLSIPKGYIANSDGTCTQIPVDVCTNLPGTQTIIPDGYEDPLSTGQCTLTVTQCPIHPGVVNCQFLLPPNQDQTCNSFVGFTGTCQLNGPGVLPTCQFNPIDTTTCQYDTYCPVPPTGTSCNPALNNCPQVNGYTATCSEGNQSCTTIPDNSWGCFLENTQVTLANGTTKNIQDIVVGDRLQGVSGVNTVQSLIRPLLGDQPTYSINGSDEFFTGNHPFLSTDGWVSLDPETTKLEIPELDVVMMKVDQILVTEKGNMLIETISPASADPSTQLYNFALDGDHTYYANGYAVHNKVEIQTSQTDTITRQNGQTTTYISGRTCEVGNSITTGQTGAPDCRDYAARCDGQFNVCVLSGYVAPNSYSVCTPSIGGTCNYTYVGGVCTLPPVDPTI